VFGNDVELFGTGLALLNPLGSAPAGSTITMGNLRIGGGQELGVNLNGTGPDHPVVFQSVTLTGGNVTFSPKTPGWNNVATIGSDLVLSNISQTATSSITMNGLRTLFITGTNTFTGPTTVSNGTLQVNGSMNSRITVAGGTLVGSGIITASGGVMVDPAGTLSLGPGISKFRTGNAAELHGTTVMKIDRSAGTNDVLETGFIIIYGGTLVISNLNDPLQVGDSFRLFVSGRYSGSFDGIIPETPGPGLVWDTSDLNRPIPGNVDGTIRVAVASAPRPQITSIFVSGSEIILSGTNGTASSQYYILSSTDIGLPISSWIPIFTNVFGTNGEFNFTNSIDVNLPQRFYLLQVP
jgi:autotransporter-associated beta strand protein